MAAYARQAVAASMGSAASGSITNSGGAITFPAVAAGGGTVTFWMLCSSGTIGSGDNVVWGTATSTVISSTQTPPTIASSGFTINLD